MKLNIVKCSPSGNITTLVFSPIERDQQPEIARHIMASEPDVEQVGFVEEPNNSRAVVRLQMMGGEFCGNAARALAWTLVQQSWPGVPHNGEVFWLEVSGATRPLQAQLLDRVVRVEMPIKRELSSVRQRLGKTVVDIEGISHVLIHEPAPRYAAAHANRVLEELDLKYAAAAGVLFLEPHTNGVVMTPYVWVRSTGTLVAESACASGSVCVALARAAASGESQTGLSVLQPSGSVISASVVLESGSFQRAFIEGPVETLEVASVR